MHVVHWNDMSMCMGNMNAGIEHGDPFHPVDLLHRPRNFLGTCRYLRGQRLRQVFEPDVMLFRYDQSVPFANWMQVKKGQNLRIFIDFVGRNFACCNLAEKTIFQGALRWVLAKSGTRVGLAQSCRIHSLALPLRQK